MIPKTGCFFPKSTIFHDFSIEIPENHVFFHVRYKNWRLVFSQQRKIENPCFFLDSYFKFPRFSIEITEIHVFSTLVKKNLVFPRFVEISTLVATLFMERFTREVLITKRYLLHSPFSCELEVTSGKMKLYAQKNCESFHVTR